MSVDVQIGLIRRGAARRRLAVALACAAPLALALIVLAGRIGGTLAAASVAAVVVVVLIELARRALRSIDNAWIARRLDAAAAQMDDSAALLFRDEAALSNLQRLQQSRLRARVADIAVDLRPRWPWRLVAAMLGSALMILVVAATWHARPRVDANVGDATPAARAKSATTIAQAQLDIAAPAYTQIPPRREATLETKAPQGSQIHWRLRFDPEPQTAALAFHDGSRLALTHSRGDWIGERTLEVSTLYRIVLEGAPALADDRLYRLDAIADRAPEVRVIQPDKTLTVLDAQQKTWDLAFEASDDYGIARADLTVTLAQGTGENITFKEQTVALTGETIDAERASTHQRYRHTLDLAALGIAQGDDVVVRLAVTDNREPKPNTTRSASFILRWPVDASSESAGMEGLVQKTMPAYFRSQRQIIIDSEALIADKPTLDDAHFLARSDALGVDQKILRLRYGQFLGEESESHAEHDDNHAHAAAAPGKSFNQTLHDPAAEAQTDALAEAHAAHERSTPAQTPPKFGAEGNTTAEYGHVHDIAEAATLLDEDTKAILKSALAEMWQSELHLRQGQPEQALPYEHRALEFIKQVQQSTRIYLARVGLELPVPDEARRLSGDRKSLSDRIGSLGAAAGDATIDQFWRALADRSAPDWDAAEAWVRTRESTLADALGVLAAIDKARREPACVECRAQLRDLLWPLLSTPAAASAPRTAPNALGRAYLDAVQAAASRDADKAGLR